MIERMKRRLIIWFCIIVPVLLTPTLALAKQYKEEKEILDGRLEGYAKNAQPMSVTIEGGSTALTWLLLVFLAGICAMVMFKNAKRTHLD
jgi:hypothetical protein